MKNSESMQPQAISPRFSISKLRTRVAMFTLISVVVMLILPEAMAQATGGGLDAIGTQATSFAAAVKKLAVPVGLALGTIGAVMLLIGDKSKIMKAIGSIAMCGAALSFITGFVTAALGA